MRSASHAKIAKSSQVRARALLVRSFGPARVAGKFALLAQRGPAAAGKALCHGFHPSTPVKKGRAGQCSRRVEGATDGHPAPR